MYEVKKQRNNKICAGEKGITLIALIITIIILLILAGVTINVLIGDNGLFNTTKRAGEEYIKAQLKEELEVEIANIQSKKLAKGEELTREDLKELSKIGATVLSVGIPAEGNYKDYNFTVDENYVVTIGVKANVIKPKIELTKNTEEVLEEITIKVKVTTEEGTVELVTKPDGTETTETEFEYKVKENKKYTFVAKGSNGGRAVESIEITNVKETALEPIIKSNYGYPVLKSTGISIDNTVTITYDNKAGLENYYSIDNGTTWNKYIGAFEITQATTIKAKSVKNGNILAESSENLVDNTDALPGAAFDRELSTHTLIPYGRGVFINVDESVWGSEVEITHNGYGGYFGLYIQLLDDAGAELDVFSLAGNGSVHSDVHTVPSGTVKIRFWGNGNGTAPKLYEIKPAS